MKRTVEFKNVGRQKRSWTAEVEWIEGAILREVLARGGLMSRSSVDVELSSTKGTVYAGLYAVGQVVLAPEEVVVIA